ncbi:hypothetical protein V6N13_033387 [Hibiscus sabdariffa]
MSKSSDPRAMKLSIEERAKKISSIVKGISRLDANSELREFTQHSRLATGRFLVVKAMIEPFERLRSPLCGRY